MSKRDDTPRSYRFTPAELADLAFVADVRGLSQAETIRRLIREEKERLTAEDVRGQLSGLLARVSALERRLPPEEPR